MRKILALVLAGALLALTGCGLAEKAVEKATEKAVEKATGVSVDSKGGSVTLKGKDGETLTIDAESGGKLPEGFPFQLYPGAKVNSSSRMTADGKASYVVEIGFKGEAAPVADFYEKAISEKGIEDMSRTESESNGTVDIFLTGDSETEGGFITITVDTKTEEGTASFIWGAK